MLAEIGDALHPAPDPSDRLFVIVRYYIDVSGKKGHRVMAAGGYIASQAQWDAFEEDWGAILELAGVDEFHATDFYACERKFSHLKKDSPEHKQLARLFAETAYRHTAGGRAFGVDLRHFHRDLAAHAYREIKTPHERMLPAMYVVGHICSRMAQKRLPPSGPRAVALIEEGDGVGEIIDWLWHLKRTGEPWTAAYENFAPVPKSERPVQAADLLAHEAWREITKLLKQPGRRHEDIRAEMKILSVGQAGPHPGPGRTKIDLEWATQENFEATARNLERFIASRPQYQWTPRDLRLQRRRDARRRWRERRKWIVGRLKGFWYGRLGMRWP